MQAGKRARIKKGWPAKLQGRGSRSGGCSKFRTRPVTSSPSWRRDNARHPGRRRRHGGGEGGLDGGAGEGRALGTDLSTTEASIKRNRCRDVQMAEGRDGCWGGGDEMVASGRSRRVSFPREAPWLRQRPEATWTWTWRPKSRLRYCAGPKIRDRCKCVRLKGTANGDGGESWDEVATPARESEALWLLG